MQVGVARIVLRLPENHSLKGKRRVVGSLLASVRSRFNVSIAEIEENDAWQVAVLGLSCVSNNGRHANEMLSSVVEFIETGEGDYYVADYSIDIAPAF